MTVPEWHLAGILSGGLFCGTSGLLSFWLARRLLRKGPVGTLGAMVSGLVLRSSVGLGGSALAFTARQGWTAAPGGKIAFWLWVLAAYLATLIAELVLLARRRPEAAATETRKG